MRVHLLAVSVLLAVLVLQTTPAQADMNSGIGACPCHMIAEPVCGSDNKTYGNDCELNCDAKYTTGLYKTTAAQLDCDFKRDSPCICPLYLWPVYRSDNHIYGNNCDLECTRNTPEGRLIGLHQVSMDKCNAEP
uniref:Kazal-like domain-containing protein n=1 Tax=Anopheles quadriannulatus TaxID=34691 RepID=A0A182WTA9_ANOQN